MNVKINWCVCALTALLLGNGFTSCTSTRQLTYLQGSFDTAQLSKISIPETRIQTGDLLNITVYSDNPVATAPFNQQASGINGQASFTASSAQTGTAGYLVDQAGNISFPLIGSLHVEGLNKEGLTQLLNEKLKPYLNNPYYNIRFLNYKITLLGEFNKPGIYSIPNERVNVLEAVGLGGDLTFFGKRDNVLVIREMGGTRQFGRIDLRDPKIFNSPYFNLQQNDVVFVEMNKKKVSSNDQSVYRNVTIATSIVSMFALVYSVLRR